MYTPGVLNIKTKEKFLSCMSGNSFKIQPPYSPHFSTLYFYPWIHFKTILYSAPNENEDKLQQHMFMSCQPINNHFRTFEILRQSMIRRVHACISSRGGHFKNWM